ncbi:MAG: response regulator [Cytophagales bacterium]
MGTTTFNAVMIVDDNEIDNLINQKMIEAAAFAKKILTHTGAKSALEYLKSIEVMSEDNVEKFLPEVIFLDIDMPIMDGFQFLEEYASLSQKTKDYVKIIMLTSSINPQDLAKSRKNNYVVQFFNKPLSLDTLSKISGIA